MFDHTIRIKKDNKIICAFGCNFMYGYDNVQWWQLDELVKAVKSGFNTIEELIEKVERKAEYFHHTDEYLDNDDVLDLDSNTIDMPIFPLFRPEEVSPDTCCISLKIKDGKYYSVYEDDEEYPMPYIEFDRVDLLKKSGRVPLDDFKIVCDFVNGLIDEYNDTDFVLNNEWIVRFNFA